MRVPKARVARVMHSASCTPIPRRSTCLSPLPIRASKVKFSELLGDKNTLLLYSFMYGPSWDKPCPSCTSLVDGFDRTWYQVSQDAAFVAIAKAPADRINAWAKQRGWSQIPLVSGADSPYQADYKCQGDSDDMQWPVMHFGGRMDGFFISGELSYPPIT